MALDMIAYCILRNLSEKQDAYKQLNVEGNLPLEFTDFIEFTSLFFKVFPWVDM